MHDPHHHAPSKHDEANPVKAAIGVSLGAIAVIIGIMLLANYAVGSYGQRPMKDEPAMSAEAVAKRIAPVAQVAVDPNAPVAPATGSAPAAAPVAAAAATPAAGAVMPVAAPAAGAKSADAGGKATYDSVCNVCHGAGVAGAPKLGDKAAWAPRVAAGKPALYNSALKGKGAMPPKGGNASLSDDAVKAAVDYMVSAAK